MSGGIAFSARGVDAHFANLRVESSEEVQTIGTNVEPAVFPPGLITHWDVSPSFIRPPYDEFTVLPEWASDSVQWQRAEVEENGIVNLGRYTEQHRERKTVLVRTVLNSAGASVQRVKFGFSDEVSVFLNGKAVYVGADGFQSRDYRFTGVIGLHDELVLALKDGPNELIFAVTELSGGWGLIAQHCSKLACE